MSKSKKRKSKKIQSNNPSNKNNTNQSVQNNTISLAWMYPDILNLHGERGNAQCFKYVAEKLNIELNIERIDDIEAKIDFDKYDILLFNCGELKVVPTILEFLKPQLNSLKKYIKMGKYLISTGTTSAFLGNKITLQSGDTFNGLNIINCDFKERDMVIGDDIYFTLANGQEIVGSQIQMVDVNINNEKPLGSISYGYGNIANNYEGVRKNNLIFTNCLGPVFVKNPWFAEDIIRDICKKKNIQISKNIKPNFEIEKNSLEATKTFINNKCSNV